MESELINWWMVFLRASGLLMVFPIFSAAYVPIKARLALGILLAFFVAATLPPVAAGHLTTVALAILMAKELAVGLLLGFVTRMLFFGLEMAGGLITTEIGLSAPPSFNPLAGASISEGASLLFYLAAILWLSLDLHHLLLLGFLKTYDFLPVSALHLHEPLLRDMVGRSAQIFGFAVLLAAPVLAVSFLINLVFSVLGRAVPQMNVFGESFAVRILAGLLAFGLSCNVMAQYIVEYLRRLPEDMLAVAQLMGLQ